MFQFNLTLVPSNSEIEKFAIFKSLILVSILLLYAIALAMKMIISQIACENKRNLHLSVNKIFRENRTIVKEFYKNKRLNNT